VWSFIQSKIEASLGERKEVVGRSPGMVQRLLGGH
jgi:hypothetical protein